MDATTEKEYSLLRATMVEEQLAQRGIENENVLQAMREVKRHLFVQDADTWRAYGDHPLAITQDQTISQPYVVASMTEALEIDGTSRVLEIGTGCGYQSAVLAEVAAEVYSIECIAALHQSARDLLSELGYDRINLRLGDGATGWPEKAPFDGIIVTAAAPRVPPLLLDQLADGGRMIIPIGTKRGKQTLIKFARNGTSIERQEMYTVRFVPMTGDIGRK